MDGGSPKSVDVADQRFDRIGDVAGHRLPGFCAHDHFLADAGRLCSLQSGRVRPPPSPVEPLRQRGIRGGHPGSGPTRTDLTSTNPSNRAERPRTSRWNPANRLTGRPRTPQPRKASPTTQSENLQATTLDPRKIRVREHCCVANHGTAHDGNLDSLEIAGAAPPIRSSGTKVDGLADHPNLACCQFHMFGYPIGHVAAQITRNPDGRLRSPRPTSAPRSLIAQAQPYLGVLSRLHLLRRSALDSLAAKIAVRLLNLP